MVLPSIRQWKILMGVFWKKSSISLYLTTYLLSFTKRQTIHPDSAHFFVIRTSTITSFALNYSRSLLFYLHLWYSGSICNNKILWTKYFLGGLQLHERVTWFLVVQDLFLKPANRIYFQVSLQRVHHASARRTTEFTKRINRNTDCTRTGKTKFAAILALNNIFGLFLHFLL